MIVLVEGIGQLEAPRVVEIVKADVARRKLFNNNGL